MTENVKRTTIAEELGRKQTLTYFTIGVSMQPLLIERKTHVMIVPLENAKNNDIVLYVRKNKTYVLHRLMKQDKDYFYMRGDNTYGLEKIKKNQAIGVVKMIYRNGKYIDVKKNKIYKLYVIFWRFVYPLRWMLWMLRRFFGKMKRILMK